MNSLVGHGVLQAALVPLSVVFWHEMVNGDGYFVSASLTDIFPLVTYSPPR
jgi:hypothetical protein